MRNISTFEPFVESIAQLIIKLCIWTFYLQDHLEKFQGKVNPLFEDSSPPPFFIFTTIISGLASILGITRFFKEGPVKFLPQSGMMNGLLTFKFILTFISILFNLFSKILLLVMMLYVSLGVLGVFATPSLGSDLVGTVVLLFRGWSAALLCPNRHFVWNKISITLSKVFYIQTAILIQIL